MTRPISNHTQGVILVVAAAIFWSFGGLWIKSVRLDDPSTPEVVSPIVIGLAVAGARSAVAALVMFIYLRGARFKLDRNLLLGAGAYAGTVLFFVLATRTTTAANAILLQYTAPVWVALLSFRLLGEPIRRIDWGTIVIVMGGMVLFFMDSLQSGGGLGNGLAVVSGIFFALCVISLRHGRHGTSAEIVLAGNILTAIVGLPFLFATEPAATDVLYLTLLGTVQLGLGYILFLRGMAYVSAIEGALLPVIEPVLNPIWVAVFGHELPSVLAVSGGLLVITAVAVRAAAGAAREMSGKRKAARAERASDSET